MEDDLPATSVLSKMSLQDQKALYSVPSVDGGLDAIYRW
jgi:hypothetical protein